MFSSSACTTSSRRRIVRLSRQRQCTRDGWAQVHAWISRGAVSKSFPAMRRSHAFLDICIRSWKCSSRTKCDEWHIWSRPSFKSNLDHWIMLVFPCPVTGDIDLSESFWLPFGYGCRSIQYTEYMSTFASWSKHSVPQYQIFWQLPLCLTWRRRSVVSADIHKNLAMLH